MITNPWVQRGRGTTCSCGGNNCLSDVKNEERLRLPTRRHSTEQSQSLTTDKASSWPILHSLDNIENLELVSQHHFNTPHPYRTSQVLTCVPHHLHYSAEQVRQAEQHRCKDVSGRPGEHASGVCTTWNGIQSRESSDEAYTSRNRVSYTWNVSGNTVPHRPRIYQSSSGTTVWP